MNELKSRPLMLVTGATGKTGMPTVAELCEKGHRVRAVVHKHDARSKALRDLGAEIVVADLYDYEEMLAAMQGVQRASFCPPVQPFMIQAANVFVAAAREAGVEHVVQLSQWLPHPAHPSLHTRQLWLIEQLFTMIPGTTYTLVNPGVFADPMLQPLASAAQLGSYPNLFGTLRNAPASNEDMGRCVAGALIAPERHGGKRYRPTGPELLEIDDVARIIGTVVGRPVKVQRLPRKLFLKAGRAAGAADFEVANVWHYLIDGNLGVFAVNAPTSDVFELTGRRPESFETIARRYAALPAAQPSLANKLKAVGDFLRMMLMPPLRMDKHDAAMRYPAPPALISAGESRIWHEQHATNSGTFAFSSRPERAGQPGFCATGAHS